MFQIKAKVNEKDLGSIIKFLNTQIDAHDIDISYIPRGETTSQTSYIKSKAKKRPMNKIGKLEELILLHFKNSPNMVLNHHEVGQYITTLGYSKTSASGALSVLAKFGRLKKPFHGQYQYRKIGNDIVEVINNVTEQLTQKSETSLETLDPLYSKIK